MEDLLCVCVCACACARIRIRYYKLHYYSEMEDLLCVCVRALVRACVCARALMYIRKAPSLGIRTSEFLRSVCW